MKFGWVNQHNGYAGRRDDLAPWIPLSDLGLDVPDLPALVEIAERIPDLLGGEEQRSSTLPANVMLGCPVVRPGKIIAVGLNYADHIRETGATRPTVPITFAKYASSLAGPYQEVLLDPAVTEQVDYEGELAVVIGKPARRVTEADSHRHVFAYAVANDVSARDLQRKEPTLTPAKSLDTFCPIGPWLTTADEIADPQSMSIQTTVNGESRQDSTTAEMIFSVAELISFLSHRMTLHPGDVILTGTPHGVGLAREPQVFLGDGDTVAVEIAGLGRIENRCVIDSSALVK